MLSYTLAITDNRKTTDKQQKEIRKQTMEYFDIVDINGMPTGETVSRDEAHDKGIPHRTVHTWVVKKEGTGCKILLQKRSAEKDSFPGMYDTSSAGHISAGDEPLESAIRELGEELGIGAAKDDLSFAGKFHFTYEVEFRGKMFRDDQVAFVYVFDKPVDINTLTLQTEEVEEVKWFDLEETYRECIRRDNNMAEGNKTGGMAASDMTSSNFCVPTEDLEILRKYLGVSS